MGLRDWYSKANDKAAAHREAHQFDVLTTDFRVWGDKLQLKTTEGFREYPVAGSKASFESGAAATSRITATRVLTGAVILGPLGAILGGMAKKDTSRMFLIVEAANGDIVTTEAKAKDEAKVREFVTKANQASAHFAALQS